MMALKYDVGYTGSKIVVYNNDEHISTEARDILHDMDIEMRCALCTNHMCPIDYQLVDDGHVLMRGDTVAISVQWECRTCGTNYVTVLPVEGRR